MDALPSLVLLLLFVAAALVTWLAGVRLSSATDVLDQRLHLGSALGGLVLLALATNLPELAITASAAASHQLGVATGNILGGIAVQTVVLVVLDAAGPRRAPLTWRAASLVLVLEGLTVVAVLAVVVMGTQLSPDLRALRLTPAVVGIALVWVAGLLVVQRAQRGLPWQQGGTAPDAGAAPRGARKVAREHDATRRRVSTGRAALVFGVAALLTLVCGVVLERAGDALAGRYGLSGAVFGATFLAAATSLPEVSTGLASVRAGDDQLAVSDIFGGNAFLPVLFLLATLVSGDAVLPAAGRSDVYLTALGVVLTVVYVVGLVLRPRRSVLRMGVDSLLVLVLYALGIAGLVALGR